MDSDYRRQIEAEEELRHRTRQRLEDESDLREAKAVAQWEKDQIAITRYGRMGCFFRHMIGWIIGWIVVSGILIGMAIFDAISKAMGSTDTSSSMSFDQAFQSVGGAFFVFMVIGYMRGKKYFDI